MIVKTIASGSKANCTIVLFKDAKFIVDIGIPYLTLAKALEKDNLKLNDFNGVLITHAHSDHIRGLASIIKKTKLNAYIPEGMYDDIKGLVPIERCVFIDKTNFINDVVINTISTSHDAQHSVGYIFEENDNKCVYITDTGYINRKYLRQLENADIYVFESNHDEQMLMDGSYPYFLKQRILSDKGHLSNESASKYLKKLVGKNTKHIILAHLSESNNTPEAAYDAITSKIDVKNIEITVAKQDEEGPRIEV